MSKLQTIFSLAVFVPIKQLNPALAAQRRGAQCIVSSGEPGVACPAHTRRDARENLVKP